MKIAIHKDGRTAVVLTEFWLDGQGFLTVENPDKTWSTWATVNCEMFESVAIARPQGRAYAGREVYNINGDPLGRISSIFDNLVLINNPAAIVAYVQKRDNETFVKI